MNLKENPLFAFGGGVYGQMKIGVKMTEPFTIKLPKGSTTPQIEPGSFQLQSLKGEIGVFYFNWKSFKPVKVLLWPNENSQPS